MDEGSDEAAILALIEAEALAFWNKDFEAVAACHLDAPFTRRQGWWARGGITNRRGWAEIGARMRDVMTASPERNDSASAVRRENMVIRVSGDMAWAVFDQVSIDTGDLDMDMPGVSHEARVFERHDGQWKIVYMNYLLRG